MNTQQVDVLMVTYGNRWPLLRQTMTALLHLPVRKVILVDNGSIYDVQEQLQTITHPEVSLITVPENKGSAFAIRTGLLHAQEDPAAGWILLLDDDTIPTPDCITHLLEAREQLSIQHAGKKLMLQCMRPDRAYLRYTAKGINSALFFPLTNHFLGFHIFRPDIRWKKRQTIRRLRNLPDQTAVEIPCAPYGGLFLDLDGLDTSTLPDPAMHTYADDFDWTLACTQQGTHLYLIPSAIVEDQEPTLISKHRGGIFSSKFFDMPPRRLFLLMRNTTYSMLRRKVDNPLIFRLNGMVYSGYLFCSALLHRKTGSFKIYNFAIRQGMRGILRNEDIPK